MKSKRQQIKNCARKIDKTVSANYLLYLPIDYETDTSKKFPLMMFLHGAGERGNDLALVKRHGLPRLIEEGTEFDFIIVSPQCPENEDWSTEVLSTLLDDVVQNYRINTNRIYLTGLSMGGQGVWDLAIEYPERFAAIVPVCGRLNRNNPAKASRLKNVPGWVFHGAKDNVVPISDSETMVKALSACGADVTFTMYPEAGHDAWTETYNNPELYQWLLKQKRNAYDGYSG